MLKKTNLQRIFIGLIIVGLTAIAAFAQTTTFTYQGKLTDSGTPQAIYQMEFKLFGSAGGNDQIGTTVTNTNVSVNGGVFTVNLDFGAPAFPGADRYLEISVRRNAGENFVTLNPRQQIASSPYSIRTLSAAQADVALDAKKLGGVNASEYVTTTSGGNSFIRNSTTPQTADFNISGNGIIGSSVGIGVTPSAGIKLDVSGDTQFRTSGSGGNILLHTPSAETGMSIIGTNRADIRFNGSTLKLLAGFGTAPPSNGIAVNTSGDVGIGTFTPTTKLMVQSPLGSYGITNTTGAVTIGTYLGGSSSGAAGGWFGTLSNDSLYFFTNSGQPNMTIAKTSGNVGIGTITPNTRLTLSGGTPWTSAGWTASMNLQNASAFGWEANASGQRFGIGQSTGGLYFFRTNSAFGNTASPANYDMAITDAGNIAQARDKGGLVKAMIYVNADGSIIRCYNGITHNSTASCGFNITIAASEYYRIDFDFQVNDRFVSVTPQQTTFLGSSVYIGAGYYFEGTNRVVVRTFITNAAFDDAEALNPFMIFIY